MQFQTLEDLVLYTYEAYPAMAPRITFVDTANRQQARERIQSWAYFTGRFKPNDKEIDNLVAMGLWAGYGTLCDKKDNTALLLVNTLEAPDVFLHLTPLQNLASGFLHELGHIIVKEAANDFDDKVHHTPEQKLCFEIAADVFCILHCLKTGIFSIDDAEKYSTARARHAWKTKGRGLQHMTSRAIDGLLQKYDIKEIKAMSAKDIAMTAYHSMLQFHVTHEDYIKADRALSSSDYLIFDEPKRSNSPLNRQQKRKLTKAFNQSTEDEILHSLARHILIQDTEQKNTGKNKKRFFGFG